MDSDYLESGILVGVVPGGDVRDRALAVDAGVRPEVDEHDLALELGQVDRLVVLGVEPLLDARDVGGGAAALELGGAVGAEVEILVLLILEAAQVELLGDLLRVGELILEGTRVVGDESLDELRHVEHQADRQGDHEHPADDADALLVLAERLHPLGDAAAGEREHEQRQCSAEREAHREHDRLGADAAGRAGDSDGREHWSGARNVDGAESETEHESAPVGADVLLRDPRERLLQDVLELRHDEPNPDEHEHDDARPAQEVLRQIQQREDQRADQGEDAERHHEAGDDEVGAPARDGGCGIRSPIGAGAERATRQEDDRQHREYAGRDSGDEATEESDEGEAEHVVLREVRRGGRGSAGLTQFGTVASNGWLSRPNCPELGRRGPPT